MGGVRRRDSPIEMPQPKRPHVGFAETLVTGVSRPLTNNEHWALWYFESHAGKCRDCRKPHIVQQEGRQLCDRGFERAYDVAKLLFKLRNDGTVYCRNKYDNQEVRVELPRDYENVIGLFKAIQRSHDFLEKPTSYDRTYYVAPRLRRGGSVRSPREPVSPSSYDTRTIEPHSPRPRKSRKSRQDPARNSRGSLFDDDQTAIDDQDRRERLATYNLEYHDPYYYPTRRSRAG